MFSFSGKTLTDRSIKVLTEDEFMERESIDLSKTKKALKQLFRTYIISELEKYQVVNDKKNTADLRRKLISHIENDDHPLKDVLQLLGNDSIKAIYVNLNYKDDRQAISRMKKYIVKRLKMYNDKTDLVGICYQKQSTAAKTISCNPPVKNLIGIAIYGS